MSAEQFPTFSAGALEVLRERYLRRDEHGELAEDPLGMLARVAESVAAPCRDFGEDAAYWRERFLERMLRLEFLPNSPTLMNAGAPGGQLAACFVLPIEDDLESIFGALQRMARIHQTGGGTGFSFSKLRPRNDRVRSTGGTTSGPISFMDLFDHTTAVVREGGRRRGANMAVLRVDHPDIEEFVEAKRKPGRLENFNLSVGVSDAFLEALDRREPFPLRNPRTGRVVGTIAATKLFDAIVESAWATGDPGLLFLDEINRHNPTPALGRIEATNPCGEQPLLENESCVLGSLNLGVFAAGDDVNWPGLAGAVRDAVVFLDNVIETTTHPSGEIAAATRRTRKLGLGVMGLADLLARIAVAYDSAEGVALGGRIAAFIAAQARATSVELGERRGSFPAFGESVWPGRGFTALRNATLTCVAPTGTISLIAGASGGIEPFFALAFVRRALDGRRFVEVNPQVVAALGAIGASGAAAIEAVRMRGSIRAVVDLPADLRRRFPIALEIAPEAHLEMQAAFQEHVDAGVSKTINLPDDTPIGAVHDAFSLARRLRLKGITVYRYGSRREQALSLVDEAALHGCRECAV
jgi:ribonucleoside-diphosphate reductase alpha chain